MITKEQIEARFELDLLEPYKRLIKGTDHKLTLKVITELWADYIKVCYENKEINKHQFETWVLSKKYVEMVK